MRSKRDNETVVLEGGVEVEKSSSDDVWTGQIDTDTHTIVDVALLTRDQRVNLRERLERQDREEAARLRDLAAETVLIARDALAEAERKARELEAQAEALDGPVTPPKQTSVKRATEESLALAKLQKPSRKPRNSSKNSNSSKPARKPRGAKAAKAEKGPRVSSKGVEPTIPAMLKLIKTAGTQTKTENEKAGGFERGKHTVLWEQLKAEGKIAWADGKGRGAEYGVV